MHKLLLATMLALASSSVFAQQLWRDVPAGATVEQVRKLLPSAHELAEPSVLADGITEALLEVDDFELVDLDFRARFFFKNGKLDRVFLNPVDRPIGMAARVAASKLRDGLLAKYGKPLSGEDRTSMLGENQEAKWVNDGAIILYMFSQYSESGTGFLQVLYMAPEDAGDL